ncbi:MAG: hypothetical protein HQL55_19475 [Magnetococcales bacterium]|nr:hypothetical protein [Magnetococcales bacterium]
MKNQQSTASSPITPPESASTPAAQDPQNSRRSFLAKFGKVAIYTPPAVLALWSSTNLVAASP